MSEPVSKRIDDLDRILHRLAKTASIAYSASDIASRARGVDDAQKMYNASIQEAKQALLVELQRAVIEENKRYLKILEGALPTYPNDSDWARGRISGVKSWRLDFEDRIKELSANLKGEHDD